MRDSADSAALGMVGGRYCFKKCCGGCFGQIGDYGVVGDYGVAHPQRDGVGGQKGTDSRRKFEPADTGCRLRSGAIRRIHQKGREFQKLIAFVDEQNTQPTRLWLLKPEFSDGCWLGIGLNYHSLRWK